MSRTLAHTRRIERTAMDNDDTLNLGWVIGGHYRIWTGDIDIVLGYKNGWVIVKDSKTGQVRTHCTKLYDNDRRVK